MKILDLEKKMEFFLPTSGHFLIILSKIHDVLIVWHDFQAYFSEDWQTFQEFWAILNKILTIGLVLSVLKIRTDAQQYCFWALKDCFQHIEKFQTTRSNPVVLKTAQNAEPLFIASFEYVWNWALKPAFHKANSNNDNDQFWAKTKRLVGKMTAQRHNRFVFGWWL